MNALRVVTIGVEAGVISTCALTGILMATENGGSMWDATPLLSVALVECLRTPVAMRIPHLKLGGALCAIALCIGHHAGHWRGYDARSGSAVPRPHRQRLRG